MIKRTISVILLFLSIPCFAGSAEKPVDKLMSLSGIDQQIMQFPGMVKAGIQQGAKQGGVPIKGNLEVLIQSVDDSIKPSKILKEVRQSLQKSLDKKEIDSLMSWYQSDLGKAITSAEEKASTQQGYQEMASNAEKLMENTKRVEQAKRIDELLGASDVILDMQSHTSLAAYTTMMTALRPDMPLNLEAYDAQMKAMEPQMQANIEKMVAVSFLYSYRDIDDKDLAQYEEFLNKDASKKFNKVALNSLNTGVKKVIDDWTQESAKIIKKQTKETEKKADKKLEKEAADKNQEANSDA